MEGSRFNHSWGEHNYDARQQLYKHPCDHCGEFASQDELCLKRMEGEIEELEILLLDANVVIGAAECQYGDEDGAWARDREAFLSAVYERVLRM